MSEPYYKPFFVTFGDLLIDFHLAVTARNEDIVRAFMVKHSKIGCWCRVLTDKPNGTLPLTLRPVELCYDKAEDV